MFLMKSGAISCSSMSKRDMLPSYEANRVAPSIKANSNCVLSFFSFADSLLVLFLFSTLSISTDTIFPPNPAIAPAIVLVLVLVLLLLV